MLSAGAIIVDSTGSRFCDEAGSKSGLGNIIMDLGQPYVYEIFDQGMADQVGDGAPLLLQVIIGHGGDDAPPGEGGFGDSPRENPGEGFGAVVGKERPIDARAFAPDDLG